MKKYITLLLAFFLSIFLLMGSYKVNAQNFIIAKISSVETLKDTKVDVTISFSNIPKQGIAACDFKIGFDNSALQVESISAGEVIKNPQLDFSYNTVNNEIIIMFVDESLGDRLIKNDGIFAKIRFYIKGSAKDGTYPVVLKSIGSFSDNDLKKLDVKFENGTITVKSSNNSSSNGGAGTVGSGNNGSTSSGTSGPNNNSNGSNNNGNSENKKDENKGNTNENQKQEEKEEKNNSTQGTSNTSKTNITDIKTNATVYQTKVNKVVVNKNKTISINFNYNVIKVNSGKIYLLDSKGIKYSISITYKGNVITIKPLKNLPKGKYTLVFSRGTLLNAYNKYNLTDIKTTFINK